MKKSETNQEIQDLNSGDLKNETELKMLREKLALADLKIEMLETMIDQAETSLSIEIRKKSGTNQ